MSAENLQHLFEPFFTTRRGQGGSGLGAHIVYNLVTGLLGGQIKAYSEAGQGLRFEIRFPKTHKSLAGSGI
jgi:signal transduction histidine kinase